MSSYVPYQVEFKVQGAGKTLGVTKKKVIWKFGFADSEALSKGFSGSGCRGSEHEVSFIWSLKSGKREIACDGKQVHFSESGMNGWTADRTFQTHFNLFSTTYGTIRCHLITLPPNHDAPGGNQPFQLRVNGVNFLDFCKIFQLGTSAMIVRPAPGGGGPRDDPYTSPEERQAIARAKLESLRDLRKVNSKDDGEIAAPAASTAEQSLISFDAPPPRQYGGNNHTMSSMTMDPGFASTSFMDIPGGSPLAAHPAPYSNYALPPSTAQYGQQPPQPAYGQPPPPAYGQPPQAPVYGQVPSVAGTAPVYGQSPAASTSYGHTPAPPAYGQPPPAPGAPQYSQQQSHGYGQPPPAPPVAPVWGAVDPSSYAATNASSASGMGQTQQQQLVVQTSGHQNTFGPSSATPQSQMTYGSAPSFAQPPSQQGQQYGGY